MVNVPIWIPGCDSHSPALLDLFLSSDASIHSTMTFPPLGNSDHVVVSFPLIFYQIHNWMPRFIALAYDYLSDFPWEGIFKLGASAAASSFCE